MWLALRVAKIDFMGEMEEAVMVLQCIRANAVPSRWQKRSFPSCRPLSVWLIGLKIRAQWLEAAWGQRGHEPLCYRLDLFWRPRLLLLSHLRVAAQKENISLDSYSFKHKVLDRIEEEEDVQDHPASGLYVVGIFLKGASWERKRARLVDHRPEELFYKMPVIHFIPSANYKPKLYKHYGLPFFHAEHFCKLSADGEDSSNFFLNFQHADQEENGGDEDDLPVDVENWYVDLEQLTSSVLRHSGGDSRQRPMRKLKVCIDNKINVGKWYDVTRNLMATSMEDLYDTQCKVTELDMQKKPALRIFAWDIECTKEPLKFPDSARDRITMISIMVDGSGFLIVNRAEVSADIEPLEYTPKPEYEGIFQTYNEEDEAALLKRFFQLMRETCPHVMVSFNGDFFDYPFVINRAKAYNMDWCEEEGFLHSMAEQMKAVGNNLIVSGILNPSCSSDGADAGDEGTESETGFRVCSLASDVPGLLRDLYEKRVEGEVSFLPGELRRYELEKAAPRELWRTVKLGDAIEVVGWWSTGHRGVHMDAKRVVVQCMRKWGVTHCIQVRQTLFAPQSQEPAQRPAALRAIRSLPVDAHGPSGSDAVSERAEAVAEFFLKAVPSLLSPSSHVLDVAGGTGLLALALARRGVRCTVVDPRKAAGCLPSRARKLARKTGFNALIRAQRAWFGGRPVGADDSFGGAEDVLPSIGEESELVRNCSGFVALHPDEATEAVVEAALRLQRPFLVVPCCVFARLFPHRRLADGRQVTSLPEFLDFLQSKHPSIRKEQLPFEGANQALWSDGKYCFDLQKSGARQRLRALRAPGHAEDGNEVETAHLCILHLQSPVLRAMLCSPMQEAKTHQVKLHPDFAKIWPLVVRFWYGLPVTVESFETAVELRKIAQYYEADELKSYTSQLIFGATPTAPRMAMLVDSLGFEEDLMERAWAYLEAHPRELFASSAWLRLSSNTVADFLRRDHVRCREPAILRALARWARARNFEESAGGELPAGRPAAAAAGVPEELLQLVRFENMTPAELRQVAKPCLPPERYVELLEEVSGAVSERSGSARMERERPMRPFRCSLCGAEVFATTESGLPGDMQDGVVTADGGSVPECRRYHPGFKWGVTTCPDHKNKCPTCKRCMARWTCCQMAENSIGCRRRPHEWHEANAQKSWWEIRKRARVGLK
ncbi:DNA polymerase epsilon catalytic subunit A (DNA polymerase II subunit A) [Durusdinium trenchii]|uniref:DNA polymerase epsilon catalytic subunit n=1 Tax=Durusdinium trenchii TaxID=1381693 RepID=A0ABP0SS93_9DINO